MAGKSHKGKNRKGAHGNSSPPEIAVSSDVALNDEVKPSELSNAEANINVPTSEALSKQSVAEQSESTKPENQAKQGDICFLINSILVCQNDEKLHHSVHR